MKTSLKILVASVLLTGCNPHNPEALIQKQQPIILSMPAPYTATHENFSQAGWNKAYARRNFQLGMTFTEFMATPFPDDEDGWGGLKIPAANIYQVCVGDEKSHGTQFIDLTMDYDDMAPGVIKCMHFAGTSYMQHPARMYLADAWLLSTKFYFIQPNGAGDYYLYKIFSKPPREGFASVREILTTGLKQRPANKEGYQLDASTAYLWQSATWDNGVSRIVLRADSDLDNAKLIYTLKPLDNLAEQRKRKAYDETTGRI